MGSVKILMLISEKTTFEHCSSNNPKFLKQKIQALEINKRIGHGKVLMLG